MAAQQIPFLVGASTSFNDTYNTLVSQINAALLGQSYENIDHATITNSTYASGTIDSSVIGGTTPAAGHFTTLDTTGNTTFSPTGTVTIAPSVAGTLNNMVIGGSTPLAGTFTTGTITGQFLRTQAVVTQANDYTLALTDAGTWQQCTKGTAQTVTVPTNAAVAFGVGNTIEFFAQTAALTFSASGGVTINNASLTAPTGTYALLKKTATNTWDLSTSASGGGAGSFTTLTASGDVTFSGSNATIAMMPTGNTSPGGYSINLFPTQGGIALRTSGNVGVGDIVIASGIGGGTGRVTLGSAVTPCEIENSNIGSSVPGTGAFTTVTASGGITVTGGSTVTGIPTPTMVSDAAPKSYVDSLSAGLSPKSSSRLSTTANLNAVYLNGASGVGATLTNAGSLVAFAVDGVSASSGDRILVKNQSSTFQNGIYTVTTVGSGAVAWILTRATDYDSSSEVVEGTYTIIEEGTANVSTLWIETGAGPFTIGTTPIVFTELSVASPTVTLTGDVTGSGAGSFATTVAKIAGVTVSGTTGTTNVVFSASPTLTGTATVAAVAASARITEGVVALSIVSTAIATNAALLNYGYVTLANGATTMSAPSNPVDGQTLTYELLQPASGAAGTVTWDSAFAFGTAGAPTLTATNGKYDLVGFRYSGRNSKWNYLGNSLGF